MCHSWERITSIAPWATHGIELSPFSARKTPNSICTCGLILRLLPQKDIPVNYQMIGYEYHLHSLVRHLRGTLLLLT